MYVRQQLILCPSIQIQHNTIGLDSKINTLKTRTDHLHSTRRFWRNEGYKPQYSDLSEGGPLRGEPAEVVNKAEVREIVSSFPLLFFMLIVNCLGDMYSVLCQ